MPVIMKTFLDKTYLLPVALMFLFLLMLFY